MFLTIYCQGRRKRKEIYDTLYWQNARTVKDSESEQGFRAYICGVVFHSMYTQL